MFDNEIIEARRFVLPPLVKPVPACASPTALESAIASTVLLSVVATALLLLV